MIAIAHIFRKISLKTSQLAECAVMGGAVGAGAVVGCRKGKKCRRLLLECGTEMASSAPAYRLVRRPVPASAVPPALDDAQQRVVSHAGGPLLVLAGPGPGKTTALGEAGGHRIRD